MKSSSPKHDPSEAFAILGHNALSIDQGTTTEEQLFRRIEASFRKESELEQSLKDTRFSLYIIAASLRRKYLNPETNKYRKEFHEWFFDRRKLSLIFKGLPNFTKCALVGELIHFIATTSESPSEDIAKLPAYLSALYQIYLVKEELFQRSKNQKIFWQLFFRTPKRKSAADSNVTYDDVPLIHPKVTEQEIRVWLDAWTSRPNRVAHKARRSTISVPVATIYVHKTIYDFDKKTGDHNGDVKLDELKALMKSVEATFTARTKSKFDIASNLKKIEARYRKREAQFDPAKKIAGVKSRSRGGEG
jgi:hypothetical protein